MKWKNNDRKINGIIKSKERIAREKLQNAIRKGEVIKLDFCCIPECTNDYICGHHYDYDLPLNVIWICGYHHCLYHHIENGEIINQLKREKLEEAIKVYKIVNNITTNL